jgi:hypothetical protein
MRTAILALVPVLLASSALTADRNRLPAQFAGEWCMEKPGDDDQEPYYRFGRCLENGGKDSLSVRTDGFDLQGAHCKVIRTAEDKNSHYLVKVSCGAGGKETKNYWMSLQMIMHETEREP